jgi:hypothetical protein
MQGVKYGHAYSWCVTEPFHTTRCLHQGRAGDDGAVRGSGGGRGGGVPATEDGEEGGTGWGEQRDNVDGDWVVVVKKGEGGG